jgi:hypothetical protein
LVKANDFPRDGIDTQAESISYQQLKRRRAHLEKILFVGKLRLSNLFVWKKKHPTLIFLSFSSIQQNSLYKMVKKQISPFLSKSPKY